MVYPIKMKDAVIKKVQMGGKLHHEIASEAGIGRSTLTYWLKNHKKDGNKNILLSIMEFSKNRNEQHENSEPD